jgi:hypothetical protein
LRERQRTATNLIRPDIEARQLQLLAEGAARRHVKSQETDQTKAAPVDYRTDVEDAEVGTENPAVHTWAQQRQSENFYTSTKDLTKGPFCVFAVRNSGSESLRLL